MSFTEITNRKTNLIANPNQLPLFLLPDISGNCTSLYRLALQLKEKMNTQIYVWHDPDPSSTPKTLEEYAAQIKQEIIKILPSGPYRLSGYSYGASVASVVAQQLNTANQEVSLCIIDMPSIPVSKEYLQPHNPYATKDLVAIFNYAANLASSESKTMGATLEEVNLDELSKDSVANQISGIKDNLMLMNSTSTQAFQNKFTLCAETMTQNLSRLVEYKAEAPTKPLYKIGVIASEEACHKHAATNSSLIDSWQPYTDNLQHETLAATHLSLVAEHSNAVAEKMFNYFKNDFQKEDLYAMSAINSGANIDSLIHRLEAFKALASNSRHASPESMPVSMPPPPPAFDLGERSAPMNIPTSRGRSAHQNGSFFRTPTPSRRTTRSQTTEQQKRLLYSPSTSPGYLG